MHYSNLVKEHSIDYTNCESDFNNGSTCASIVAANPNGLPNCTCTISFKLSEKFSKTVYLYYGISNYYQNHRRYVKSRDDNQLLGKIKTSVSDDCAPFNKNANGTVYAPCGAIANSLFNDTYDLTYNGETNAVTESVTLIRTGIAWSTDKKVKFRNPNDLSKFNETVPPPNWHVRVENLDTDSGNTGFINEDLIVWMRTAALPNFRKLHRIIDHSGSFSDGLPSGFYTVKVNYSE